VVAPAVAPVIDVGRGVLGLGPMRAASATAAAGQETPVTANSGLSAQTAMQIAQGVTAAPAAAAAQPAQNAPNMFSSIEDVAKAYPNMQLGDYMQLAESLPRGSQAQPVSGKDLVYNRAIAFLDKESNDIQNSNWPEAEKAKALAIQYNKYVALISEMAALTANAQPE
jgi:dihydroorotase-like cyclic amidohydrolase